MVMKLFVRIFLFFSAMGVGFLYVENVEAQNVVLNSEALVIQKNAENGDVEAQFYLGLMYDTGEGVPQNLSQAVYWYTQAAQQGHLIAQNNLGAMYASGNGVKQSYVLAKEWYEKSANSGFSGAQHNLGRLYATGVGVPQDYVLAHKWLNLAASRGVVDAAKDRDALQGAMLQSQVAEAQRLARDWKPDASMSDANKRLDRIAAGISSSDADQKIFDRIVKDISAFEPVKPTASQIDKKLDQINRDSSFITIDLPDGLSFILPEDWSVLSNNQVKTVDSFVGSTHQSLSSVENASSSLNFAANLYNDHKVVIGILNVRFYPDIDISQAQVRSFTADDIRDFDKEIHGLMKDSLEKTGISLVSWGGTVRKDINGVVALVTDYDRKSLLDDGLFRVRLVRVLAEGQSFTFTISYNKDSPILEDVVDRIVGSIHVSGINKKSDKNIGADIDGVSQFILLVASFFIAWLVVLLPPALIRFSILKRPMGKWKALGVVFVFFLINGVILALLGGESETQMILILVALSSQWILTKENRNKNSKFSLY